MLGSRSGATLDGGSCNGRGAVPRPSDGEHMSLELADDSKPLDTESRVLVSPVMGSYNGASCGERGERLTATDFPIVLEFVSLWVFVSTDEGVVAAPFASGGSSLNIFSGVSIIIVASIKSPGVLLLSLIHI